MNVDLTVKAVLSQASDLDLLDAQVLLAHVLRVTRSFLYSHDDRVLTHTEHTEWLQLLSRRREGVPIAYLIGEKECMGLLFEVTPDVLIPRPDTECLIETALSLLPEDARVLDIGTGSGVIACALAFFKPSCEVIASDVSSAALQVAQRNIQRHGLKNVSVVQSDIFSDIQGLFDMIVSNPPYLDKDDPYLAGEIRFEPRHALIADAEGLALLERVIEGAVMHLHVGGYLCVEHGYQQAAFVREIFKQHGFQKIQTVRDLSGHERVSVGVL